MPAERSNKVIKRTPGPWYLQIGTASQRAVSRLCNVPCQLLNDRHGWTIAHIVGAGQGTDDENDANARLIAAAPELLEVALALVGAPPKYGVGGVATLARLKVVEMARLAIAKAEGRT